MTKSADKEYPIIVYPDTCTDGAFCYVAEHPDLPGCAAHGPTIEEAKRALALAREAYLLDLARDDEEPPEPDPKRPRAIEWDWGIPGPFGADRLVKAPDKSTFC